MNDSVSRKLRLKTWEAKFLFSALIVALLSSRSADAFSLGTGMYVVLKDYVKVFINFFVLSKF